MEILSEIGVQPFTKEWWNQFMTTTANLTKTSVFKDCMDKDETALLKKYVLQIIKDLAISRTNKYGYRVYIEGILLDNFEMHAIYDKPPLADEGIEEWSKRVFGDKKFGMIINKGEKFHVELSKNIALKTATLFEHIGFPREGINFTLFIGNYDKTPLGIHQDKKGENVIHFHLGPGNKTMYTWDKTEYLELVGEKKNNNPEIENLLPYATEFAFKEGDLYFMPQGEYHIGTQDGLSVAITLWQYNHTKEKLAAKLNTLLFNEFMQKNDDLLFPDKNDLDDLSGLNEVLAIVQIPEELENLNYKDLMREAYRDLKYSLNSNAGYRTSPFPKQDELFNEEDFIQVEKPFKILYKESINGEKLHIYLRGIKIELKNYHCIKDLIDLINAGDKNSVYDLFSVLDDEWSTDVKIYMLNLLYKNHAICKVN